MSLKKLVIPIGIGLGMGAAYTPWGERLSESLTALAVAYHLLPAPAKPAAVASAPMRLRDDPGAKPAKIGEESQFERDYIAWISRLRFDEARREQDGAWGIRPEDAASALRSTMPPEGFGVRAAEGGQPPVAMTGAIDPPAGAAGPSVPGLQSCRYCTPADPLGAASEACPVIAAR
jgi:hypothetical protein